MNKINLPAVKYAALLLLSTHQSTTTKDVKDLLRHIGYATFQSEISELLQIAADEMPLEYSTNGTYRTYTLPTPQQACTSIDPIRCPPQQSKWQYTKRDGTVLIGSEVSDDPSNWMVSDGSMFNINHTVLYFSSKFTRDEVRTAYSSLVGVTFSQVRSSKVGK